MVVGGILAVIFCLCVFGGSTQISKITGFLVPFMGIFYLAVALFIVVTHFNLIPQMFADIFSNAFDLKAIFGGFTGSCIMQGIKRGLFSNEAGVGSAPNAAASASVSHPVKQGLVQMLSVFIDTILICSATAFMLLCSGVAPSNELKGMPWVQAAAAESLGSFGTVFITVALFLFAFTTLIGNYFYAEMGLGYLCDKNRAKTSDRFPSVCSSCSIWRILNGIQRSMEYSRCNHGLPGSDQPACHHPAGRTCRTLSAGLYQAEKIRQKSGLQSCRYCPERQDRLLELSIVSLIKFMYNKC